MGGDGGAGGGDGGDGGDGGSDGNGGGADGGEQKKKSVEMHLLPEGGSMHSRVRPGLLTLVLKYAEQPPLTETDSS